MPYQELKLPTGTTLRLKEVVRKQLDPLLADVHSMLRLPIDDDIGLGAGCNLSAALVLLEVVGGVSVELYDNPSLNKLDERQQRGERFKQVLEHNFPWNDERDIPNAIIDRHAAELLYDAFRNPLAHHLGTYDGPYIGNIKVAKGPLSDEQIEVIERSETRPKGWVKPTLATDSKTKAERTKTVLTVKCLYWGVRRMIWNLLEERVKKTTKTQQPKTTVTVDTTATVVMSTATGATSVTSGST